MAATDRELMSAADVSRTIARIAHQIIEKTAMIENMLAASMSPSMAAALDWSRGLQSRSIIP